MIDVFWGFLISFNTLLFSWANIRLIRELLVQVKYWLVHWKITNGPSCLENPHLEKGTYFCLGLYQTKTALFMTRVTYLFCRKIQSVFELSDGSGLVVTVARYETPAHTDIDKVCFYLILSITSFLHNFLPPYNLDLYLYFDIS